MKAGKSAQTRARESPCDLRSWRWRKDTSLVKASLTNLVDFDVHCDLPHLFLNYFLELDF